MRSDEEREPEGEPVEPAGLSRRRDQLSSDRRALLERWASRQAVPEPGGTISRRPAGGPAPLSFAQERLWFLDRLDPGLPAYVVPFVFDLPAGLDVRGLRRALEDLVGRQEVLRSVFPARDGEGVQVVLPAGCFALPVVDLAGLPPVEAVRVAEALALREITLSFDLGRDPALRARLLRLPEGRFRVCLTLHHIAFDAWSAGILLHELEVLYRARSTGGTASLPALPVQYSDYAAWQREWMSGELLERELAYWRAELEGVPPGLALPTDRPRPERRSSAGGHVPVRLTAELAAAVSALARQADATPFVVLLAAFEVLLFRYTDQDDLVIGTPILNRSRRELEGLIGFFTNTLVLRAHLDEGLAALEVIRRTRGMTLAAFEHQDLPFEKLVQELNPERGLDHHPLFQVMLALENRPRPAPARGAARLLGNVAPALTTSKFDLTLGLAWAGEAIEGAVEYSTDLFDRSTVLRLAAHFRNLLASLTQRPACCVCDLVLMDPAERAQLLVEWNDTRRGFSDRRCLHELVEAQVDERPEAVAVELEDGALSYGELERLSNRLANRLRALGAGPEVLVAISVERSLAMLVGMLGVLKAGAAYLPLDPELPADRLADLLADSAVPLLLTALPAAGTLAAPPGCRVIALDAPAQLGADRSAARPAAGAGPEHLAYVIYTSGSTGKPKGVLARHPGAVNRLEWAQRAYPLRPSDRVLQTASAGFDFSVWECFGPLLAGGTVVLAAPGGQGDPPYLATILAERRITLVHFVPSMLQAFLAGMGEALPACPALRCVLTGGEALPSELAEQVRRRMGVPLRNQYGPTEVSIDATESTFEAQDLARRTVPIGRPLANTTAYVLDRASRPKAIGVAGELFLGGAGVTRGYLGRPALTAERFVPDSFGGAGGARLYRTGDLVRWLADGRLEFLRRTDHQVKVRGYRIEPGEVESVLRLHPGVADAVVTAQGEGAADRRLVAYFVPARQDDEPSGADLRAFLRQRLPVYMVPSLLLGLPALPLTPSGKLDRTALPRPEAARRPAEGPVPALRTPVEEIVAEIWARVLGVPRLAPDDDFFALGGHSLLATQVTSRVTEAFAVELPLRALFESPTVAGFAARVEAARRGAAGELPPPLVRVPRAGPLPVSFAQQRLWFLQRWAPGSATYNVPLALSLRGELSVGGLARALSEVVRRHEVLRTTFELVEGEPMQRIHPPALLALPVLDLRRLGAADRAGESARLAAREARRPFDLATRWPLREALIRRDAGDHLLLSTLHHVASDGWSTGVLRREVATLYRAAVEGRPASLPELPVQYADFAVWQRGWLTGEVLDRQLAFWRQCLAGAPAVLDLPADRARPATRSERGGLCELRLPAALAAEAREMARQAGVSGFMSHLAAFVALLARYTGSPDVVVGTPVAGRGRVEIEGLIGFFANTLVLRTDLGGDPSFSQLLARVRETVLSAHAHQDLPFEKLVEELAPERSTAHSPLVQVMFLFEPAAAEEAGLPGLDLARVEGGGGTAKFDLTLALAASASSLRGVIEFSADLFDATTISRLGGHYATLLSAAVAEPGRRLSELPLAGEAERAQLLCEWNDSAQPFSATACLHDRFEARADERPDAVALEQGDEALSYAELKRRAKRLADRLCALGVGPGAIVALCVERSVEMVEGVLGVLEAGGAYLPLDPEYPAERLSLMLEDAAAAVLLTQERLRNALALPSAVPVIALDEPRRPGPGAGQARRRGGSGAQDLVCVLYTSGSTGRPKGVMVRHQGMLNRVEWAGRAYPVTAADRVLQKASISFDFSVWECFGPLLAGGTVVLARPGGQADPVYLARTLVERRITLVHFVPSMLQAFLAGAGEALVPPPALRFVLAGGEALGREAVEEVSRRLGVPLRNQYGPTEISIDTTEWVCAPRDLGRSSIPIGRPLANARLYVLDGHGRPQPVAVPGELFLGGAGVVRGYLGRPALTAERFVPDPFGGTPGERLYRTGDLGRWLAEGSLEFLGRTDHQVKVRGYRIEPGEVESALRLHPEVEEAAVVAQGEGPEERRLVAYLVARTGGETPASEALRRHLLARLPAYMVPAAFVSLAALPLTPSGKLDRRALPAAERGREEATAYVAPRTAVEELLAEIWAAVLELPRVGVEDDFFALGGHSLLAVRVASRLYDAFRVEIPLRTLFEAPTIARLAREVEAARRETPAVPVPPLLAVPRGRPLPLSFAQQRLWFLDRLSPGGAVYNIPSAWRVEAALSARLLAAALSSVARRHETLRTRFVLLDSEPAQVISEDAPVGLPAVDLGGLGEADAERLVDELVGAEARRPFDLESGPLLRVLLLCLRGERRVVTLTVHHIVADAWSMGLLAEEVALLYEAFAAGRASPLPELAIQYADYASWQRQWLDGEVLEAQLGFWRRQLAGRLPTLDLPADRPRRATASQAGATLAWELSHDLGDDLRRLSRRCGATLFMTLLAGFQALLCRLTGLEDVLVGIPVAGRNRTEVERLIGFFVNLLVVRTDLAGEPAFLDLVGRTRETVLGAFMHQDVPFEKLVAELQPERSLRQTPFFQVVFQLLSTLARPQDERRGPGEPLPVGTEAAKFDLAVTLAEGGGAVSGGWIYRPELFDRTTIERLARSYEALLAAAVADPRGSLARLSVLAPGERHQLAVEWPARTWEGGGGDCLHGRFEARARERPDAVAVVSEEESWSYRGLATRAHGLAARLRLAGVGAETKVALCLRRSWRMVLAMIAVLEAGGAYLPLDPADPDERLRFLLGDARPRLLLTERGVLGAGPELASWCQGMQVLSLDDLVPEALSPSSATTPGDAVSEGNLAYLIYTSGSTGQPKGVMVEHGSVVQLLDATRPGFGFDCGDVWTLFHSYAFDFSVWEVWGALATGGRLVVVPHPVSRSPEAFWRLLGEQRVTVLNQTPSAFLQLLWAEPPPAGAPALDLRWVVLGGEALDVASLAPWFARHGDHRPRLVNMYGITETTVHVTRRSILPEDLQGPLRSPIGVAIPDLGLHLLDRRGEPVAIGVAAELCVVGRGVARGYHARPALTAQRFAPDPFAQEPGARLYRSGDLARRRAGGELEFLGRIDHQVKVRGFRIELGEVEAALRAHPAVRQAVVVAHEEPAGDRRLVAYLVGHEPGDPALSAADELRGFLAAKLPEHMLPAVFLRLERLPLTPNGKLDRHALPAPEAVRPGLAAAFVAPATALQLLVAGHFRAALGIDRVGLHDDFFALGGDSIRGAILINRLQQELGEIVHVVAIFDAPTVGELAEHLARSCPTGVHRRLGDAAPEAFRRRPAVAGVEARVGGEELRALRELIRPLPPAGKADLALPKNPSAVFVLAPPRSGTTLLRVMLAGHPRLFAPPELELLSFRTMAERRAAFSGRDAFWLEGLIQAVRELRGVEAEEARRLVEELEARELTTRRVYARLQEWLGGRTLVDKTPSYALDPAILERAEEEFDEPRYLHLLRHPGGMVQSFVEAKLDEVFFRTAHGLPRRQLAELLWVVSHQNLDRFLDRVPARRRLRVVFEDLVRRPAAVLERVCDFLGLDVRPEMADPYGAPGGRMIDGLHASSRMLGDVKLGSFRGVEASVAERWRESLSEESLGEITWQLAEALGYRRRESGEALPPILASPRDGSPLALSFAQERLWFLDRLAPGLPTYNVPLAVRASGALDGRALVTALGELGRRHEVLRTRFVEQDGRPVAWATAPSARPLPQVDLAGLSSRERETEARRLARAEARRPFDLARGAPLRTTWVRLGGRDSLLLATLHHIAADGWSLALLTRELGQLYAAFAAGQPSPLPELAVQYADFAAWQRARLSEERLAAELSHWRQVLGDAPRRLELPTDRPRPAMQRFHGAERSWRLPRQLSAGLEALARSEGVTLFMLLLAAFQGLLARIAGQPDLLVGSPVAGRTRAELEGLIGLFVNTLVLRGDVTRDPPFRAFLAQVRATALQAFAHQELPFERLVEALVPQRDLSRSPLVEVMFALQSARSTERLVLPGLRLEAVEGGEESAKFDLTLAMAAAGGGIGASLGYDSDLFDATTIGRLAGQLENLLAAVVDDPARRLSDLPLLSAADRHQLLVEWGDGGAVGAWEGPVHALAGRRAALAPDAVALVDEAETVSYGELDRRAEGLAAILRGEGVGPDVPVAVLAPRDGALVTSALAVLKAGGAYLPLDVGHPAERIRFMLEDSAAPVLLVTAGEKAAAPAFGGTTIEIESGAVSEPSQPEASGPSRPKAMGGGRPEVGPSHLAYLIYTSGSTGRPKGVACHHAALANLVRWHRSAHAVTAADRATQLASPAFDASVWEIWPYLASGASLHLPPEELRRDPAGLVRWLAERRITLAFLPTPLAEAALAEPEPSSSSLRSLLTGGDRLRRRPADRVSFRLCNHYGPTEATVVTTMGEVEAGARAAGPPAIGRPIAGARVAVRSPLGGLAPVGVWGELAVAGPCLARGYASRPALTAERFVPDPSGGVGERMYRTGDQVRWLPDGRLDFRGRIDQQVKLRGFRLELGEIEAVLAEHPALRRCAVVYREEPEGGRLVAYVVAEPPAAPTAAELRAFLAARLPEPMLPAVFVPLSELPLGTSGKLDRRALPPPEEALAPPRGGTPRDLVELQVMEAFEEVLGRAGVALDDDFFALGGHSLMAVRLAAAVRRRLDRELPLAAFFETPTVEGLAARLRRGGAADARRALVALRRQGSERPLFLVHPVGGNAFCYLPLVRRLDPELPVWALQSPDEELPTLERMAGRYLLEMRSVQPGGPYRLGGWSMGGVVAFEMARQLLAAGESVELLALIDSFVPLREVEAIEEAALRQGFAAELAGFPPADSDPGEIERLFALFARNRRALARYRPQACPVEVLLLAADAPRRRDPAPEWRRLALALDHHPLSGDHESLLREPVVEGLARALGARLRQAVM